MNHPSNLVVTLGVVGYFLIPAYVECAETGDASSQAVLEQVIVTAQKRTENLQDVPMSISVLSSIDLDRSGAVDFQDYSTHIPNLAVGYSASSLASDAQTPALRGIFGTGTTGVYLDDTALTGSLDPRVIDLDRVEVLRGPQGTLYGARSMGGTLRLITRQPDLSQLGGDVHVVESYSNHGGLNSTVDGRVNIPVVTDHIAIRAVGYYDHESGVYTRVASLDAPVNFGRMDNIDASHRAGGEVEAKGAWLDDALTITPRVIYERSTEAGREYADYRAGNFTQQRLFNIAEPGTDEWHLYTLTGRYMTSLGEFTSATSEYTRHTTDTEDFSESAVLIFAVPPTPAIIHGLINERAFSQELRFASTFQGPIQLTAGTFYQRNSEPIVVPPTPIGTLFDNIYSFSQLTTTTEKALFGEVTWDVTDKLSLIAGARAFRNTVDFTATQAGTIVNPETFNGIDNEHGVDPKYSIVYKFSPNSQVYATAAKGYRIGGVNTYSATACAGDLAAIGLTAESAATFKSDSVWSYELGSKTSWLDRRLSLNGSIFHIRWDGVQQFIGLPCGFFLSVNAGRAQSDGAELETDAAVTENLKFSLGVGFTNARIVDAGGIGGFYDGERVQQVPRWTGTANVDYTFLVENHKAFIHADDGYTSSSISENNSTVVPYVRPSYNIANLRLGSQVDNVQVALFVKNIFDVIGNLGDSLPLGFEVPGRPRIVTTRPRTIGLDVRVKF